MVIAHVVKSQAIAGAESHLFKLIPALASSGTDVHVVSIADGSHGPPTPAFEARLRELEDAAIPVHRLRVRGKADPTGAWRVARTVRAVRPDIVHTHLPYADLFGALGARLAGSRRILSTRHRDYSASAADLRRFRRYYRMANPLHDAVIAISHRIADLCRIEEGRDPATIETIWYGCEDQAIDRVAARRRLLAEWRLPVDALLLGTVGRLIPLKGHAYALDAFATIAGRVPQAVWVVAGEGPERATLESRAVALGLSSRIRMLGHRDDVPAVMAALDVLVHPTTAEGFGLVIVEAMLQGTPTVASRVGALPEIVEDGQSGVLVPVRDPVSLADAVMPLLVDARRRQALGLAARRRYEASFGLERMVTATLDVYRRMAGH